MVALQVLDLRDELLLFITQVPRDAQTRLSRVVWWKNRFSNREYTHLYRGLDDIKFWSISLNVLEPPSSRRVLWGPGPASVLLAIRSGVRTAKQTSTCYSSYRYRSSASGPRSRPLLLQSFSQISISLDEFVQRASFSGQSSGHAVKSVQVGEHASDTVDNHGEDLSMIQRFNGTP